MERLTIDTEDGDLMSAPEYFFDTDLAVHSWREIAACNNRTDVIWGGMTAKERGRVRRKWLEELRRAS